MTSRNHHTWSLWAHNPAARSFPRQLDRIYTSLQVRHGRNRFAVNWHQIPSIWVKIFILSQPSLFRKSPGQGHTQCQNSTQTLAWTHYSSETGSQILESVHMFLLVFEYVICVNVLIKLCYNRPTAYKHQGMWGAIRGRGAPMSIDIDLQIHE